MCSLCSFLQHFIITSTECRFNLYTEIDVEYQVDLTQFYSFVAVLVNDAQFYSYYCFGKR